MKHEHKCRCISFLGFRDTEPLLRRLIRLHQLMAWSQLKARQGYWMFNSSVNQTNSCEQQGPVIRNLQSTPNYLRFTGPPHAMQLIQFASVHLNARITIKMLCWINLHVRGQGFQGRFMCEVVIHLCSVIYDLQLCFMIVRKSCSYWLELRALRPIGWGFMMSLNFDKNLFILRLWSSNSFLG